MALSQDEQRMLAEIERRLATDDPGLASCLTTFRRPGPVSVLRSPRARIVGSLFTVLLVAMVSLMVYAMIPFRTHIPRTGTGVPPSAGATANTAGAPGRTAISVATNTQPNGTQQSSASAGTTAGPSAANGSAAATATGKQQPKIEPTNAAILPLKSP
jgi:hypothetical protein